MSIKSFADLAYEFYANYWRDAKMNSELESNANKESTSEQISILENGQGDTPYHAVYIPPEDIDDDSEENITRIYSDKIEALKLMKNYKRARLKTFGNRQGAIDYTINGGDKEIIPTVKITSDEKPVNFKGPKPQELVAFRKLIDHGELENVKNVVWENPRYLIGSGDTPAILQEGCRYNALHIAAKGQANMSQMCELLLNTVGNPDFVKLLYGEDECTSNVDRAHVLLDLYLNTPDKGLNETPLHFAAKYGLKDVVRVLVSYSQCVKTLPNKYGQTPAEVICSRKCQEDETLKKDIHMLLEDQYYVPVLRADDNTLQPIIGLPFSPTSPQRPSKIDPISPRVEVRAFAGPMTKSQALEFRKKWKTPPRTGLSFTQRREISLNDSLCSPIPHHQDPCMRLNDTEKGLERVGRELAEEYHVSWKEFWPFLNDFADFRCHEGLRRLEKYLENRHNDLCQKEGVTSDQKRNKESPDVLTDLCAKLESCSLQLKESNSESDTDDEFYTPPSSPIETTVNPQDSDCEDEMCLADEGKGIFIEGSTPSKIDFAVYNAISSYINPEVYPLVYRWRHEIQHIVNSDDFDLDRTFSSTRRKLLVTPEKPRISKF